MFFCRVIAGFGGWHMGNQSQDEVFLAAQEAVGAHRDSQGKIYDSIITTSSLTCINTSGFVSFTISTSPKISFRRVSVQRRGEV
jgi:hypothetical protein